MYPYEFQKGSRKHPCPSCGRRTFRRYVSTSTGELLPEHVGRCDRELNCSYFFMWNDYVAENRDLLEPMPRKARTAYVEAPKPFDYMDLSHVIDHLGRYQENVLIQTLGRLFPETIDDAIREYFIGTADTWTGPGTLFPYIDDQHQFCFGKIVRFAPDGHRLKARGSASSLAYELKLERFNRKITYFGEHLLPRYPDRPLMIVESEKTAIVGSLCNQVFSDAVWLATGTIGTLTAERLERAGAGRKVVLYPDAGAFDRWNGVANEARRRGVDVSTSRLIEDCATPAEAAAGFDLADYLIREQSNLLFELQQIADERRAIMEADGVSESEITRHFTSPEFYEECHSTSGWMMG